MMVCPHQPHIEAIGSQLNLPKGLYILGISQNLGISIYLVPKYMYKYVELV